MTDHRWEDRLGSEGARPNERVWAIVLAGGTGSRFGGPKTLEILGGQRVLDWSLRAARAYAHGLVLVVPQERMRAEYGRAEHVVQGGITRADSVRCGLAVIPADADIVVVHDAARPLATPALFERVIDAVRAGADGAIPGVAVVDTIKRVLGSAVQATIDRRDLVAVQTPQAFRTVALRAAHASGADATDDAGLVEANGGVVVVVEGEERNRKLTTAADLAVLEALAAFPAASGFGDEDAGG